MPTSRNVHQKAQELQAQYDVLSAKIERLRNAIAIENDPASKFKFEKQLEEAETERDQIDRALQQLEQQGVRPEVVAEPPTGSETPQQSPSKLPQPFPLLRYVLISLMAFTIGGLALWWYVYKIPSTSSFAMTVYVHGSKGKQDIVLKNTGEVLLDVGAERLQKPIDDNGAAYFPSIPAEFRNQSVPISILADGFEIADPNAKYVLTGKSIYVEIKHDDKFTKFFGTVRDADHFLKDAVIRIGELQTTTDVQGSFTLTIPPDKQTGQQRLTASKEGYRLWESFVYPGQEIKIILTKQP